MRTLGLIMAGTVALAIAAPAQAALVLTSADVGTSFRVNYAGVTGNFGNQAPTSLISAIQDFTFTSISNAGTTFNFSHRLENTSVNSSLIRSYGFDIDGATISSVAGTGAMRFGSTSQTTFPEGFGQRDVCFSFSAAGSCPSGSGGIAPGPLEAGMGTLSISFSTSPTSIILDRFIARAHTINPAINHQPNGMLIGSFAAPGVPEPATWAMMMLGFGAAGAAMRSAKRRARIAYN